MTQPLSFQVETWADMLEEALPLFQRQWQEVAPDEEPLDPDWLRYEQMAAAGALSVVTARQNTRLVGYCLMILSRALHYRGNLIALNDIFWLAPEARGRMGGKRMFRAMEREMQRRGVKRIYLGSNVREDVDASRLFLALGYRPFETSYVKALAEPSSALLGGQHA